MLKTDLDQGLAHLLFLCLNVDAKIDQKPSNFKITLPDRFQ